MDWAGAVTGISTPLSIYEGKVLSRRWLPRHTQKVRRLRIDVCAMRVERHEAGPKVRWDWLTKNTDKTNPLEHDCGKATFTLGTQFTSADYSPKNS